MGQEIVVIPLCEIEKRILDRLGECLQRMFGQRVRIGDFVRRPEDAYHPERRQYDSTYILNDLVSLKTRPGETVLGIIDVDLYVPELNFVFGQADINRRVALISIARLRQEFYGLSANEDLLLARTSKEAIHELGHLYGLGHCKDLRCVMFFSNSLADTDRKEQDFCSYCRKKLMA